MNEAGIRGWISGRLPEGWFVEAPEVSVDRDEVIVVGRLAPVEGTEGEAAEAGRIKRFREETREQRVLIAREIEKRFGQRVAWGARCGDTEQLFTTLSVPVMTRLRQPERQVLDTLVAAGVARSRSDALAWSVKLVGQHAGDWLAELRSAMEAVNKVRAAGPDAG